MFATVPRRMVAACLVVSCGIHFCGCTTLKKYAYGIPMAAGIWTGIIVISPLAILSVLDNRDGVTSATFAPDGRHILVTYKRGPYQHLYLVTSDGASCTQLTHGKRFDFCPTISPDGTRIVFSSFLHKKKKKVDLYTVNVDRSELKQLTDDDFMEIWPHFSPDGERIVFTSLCGKDQGHLFLMNADGSGVRQLTSGQEFDINPLFLPDGQKVLFVRAESYAAMGNDTRGLWKCIDLYTVTIDGRQLTRCGGKGFFLFKSLALSADGKLAALDISAGRLESIWLLSLDPPGPLAPLNPQGEGYTYVDEHYAEGRNVLPCDRCHPCFSPDGRSIVFAMTATPKKFYSTCDELHVMDLGTRESRQITNLGLLVEFPCYSPDGTRILFRVDPKPKAFRSVYQLWIVNANGANPRRVELSVGEQGTRIP